MPRLAVSTSSRGNDYAVVRDAGSLLLECARNSSASRDYDWANKRIFGISITEIGQFAVTPAAQKIELGRNIRHEDGTFERVRTLTVEPTPDMSGVHFTFAHKDDDPADADQWSVFVSNAEYFVIKTLMFSSVPNLMGWNLMMNPPEHLPKWMLVKDDPLGGGDA